MGERKRLLTEWCGRLAWVHLCTPPIGGRPNMSWERWGRERGWLLKGKEQKRNGLGYLHDSWCIYTTLEWFNKNIYPCMGGAQPDRFVRKRASTKKALWFITAFLAPRIPSPEVLPCYLNKKNNNNKCYCTVWGNVLIVFIPGLSGKYLSCKAPMIGS